MKIEIEKQAELEQVPALVGALMPGIDVKGIEAMLRGVTITGGPVNLQKAITGADGKPQIVSISLSFPAAP